MSQTLLLFRAAALRSSGAIEISLCNIVSAIDWRGNTDNEMLCLFIKLNFSVLCKGLRFDDLKFKVTCEANVHLAFRALSAEFCQ